MLKLGIKMMLLFAGKVVINRKLGRRRADRIRKSGPKQNLASHQMCKIMGINISQLGKSFGFPFACGVKPAEIIADAFVGNLVRTQLPDLLIVAQERIKNRCFADQVGIERGTCNPDAAAL